MLDDDLFDLLMDIEETVPIAERAERMEAEADKRAPGEHGRASFLVAAGEHRQMRGEYDEARRCLEAARADGGESGVDPVAALLDLALVTGDTDAAHTHRETLRGLAKADELSIHNYLQVGESYETNGQLREAHRWFTMPLTFTDPEDDEDLDYFCLIARLRVREALGLPQDRFDRIAFEERELHRSEGA